ncbi:hypothetical protein SAMN06265222_106177 [Neorhodopirellula lusitana]|uniref:Uncharacterized protein n=1 Tax=Neorhodopirellula lusitana TaxID=445327 RepID=A0ABY1Q8D6_9BACT|nr:hypothetical protein SAMN06265222_106177 [Neorhodopirellula lusitana]
MTRWQFAWALTSEFSKQNFGNCDLLGVPENSEESISSPHKHDRRRTTAVSLSCVGESRQSFQGNLKAVTTRTAVQECFHFV